MELKFIGKDIVMNEATPRSAWKKMVCSYLKNLDGIIVTSTISMWSKFVVLGSSTCLGTDKLKTR